MIVPALIDEILAALRTITTTTLRVFEAAPESMSEFPCAIVYPWEGEMTPNPAGGRSLHTLRVEVHQSRTLLPVAITAAEVWPDLVMGAIKTMTSHIVWPLRYRCGPIEYAGEKHYGVVFEIQVKVNEA